MTIVYLFDTQTQKVAEIHALVSSSKPLVTWTARDAIQEAREACGGHGYLRVHLLNNIKINFFIPLHDINA